MRYTKRSSSENPCNPVSDGHRKSLNQTPSTIKTLVSHLFQDLVYSLSSLFSTEKRGNTGESSRTKDFLSL